MFKLNNRREFIKDMARIFCFGGILGAGLILGKRKTDSTCPKQAPCRECSGLSSCNRPEAKEKRNNL